MRIEHLFAGSPIHSLYHSALLGIPLLIVPTLIVAEVGVDVYEVERQ